MAISIQNISKKSMLVNISSHLKVNFGLTNLGLWLHHIKKIENHTKKSRSKMLWQLHMNMESSLLSATKTHNFFCSKNCVFKEDYNVLDTKKLYLILKLCVFAFEKMNLSTKLPLNVYFNAKFLLFLCYKRFLSS